MDYDTLKQMAIKVYKTLAPSDEQISSMMTENAVKQYHEMYPDAPQFKPKLSDMYNK